MKKILPFFIFLFFLSESFAFQHITITRVQYLRSKARSSVGTELRISAGDSLFIGDEGQGLEGEFYIPQGSKLIISDSGYLNINPGSRIIVEEGGSIEVFSGSTTIYEKEGVVVNPGGSVTFPPLGDLEVMEYPFYDQSIYQNQLSGVAVVGATGGLSYEVPLEFSPGTGGLGPNLSVVYNSQSGDGLLGRGVNLSGLSMIHRMGSTFYSDGQQKGLQLDWGDHFGLDGERLIKTGGLYVEGSNEVHYDTESASYADIESFGNGFGHSGPREFVVKSKDGSTLYYGSRIDGRIEFPYPNSHLKVVYQWLLTRREDANGNYMDYYYITYNGTRVLSEIRYTGNLPANIVPYNKVVFQYKSKLQSQIFYVAGHRLEQNVVLDKIEGYCEGLPIKTYCFGYDSTLISLKYIREYTASDSLVGHLDYVWTQKGSRNFSSSEKVMAEFGWGSGSGGWNKTKYPRMLADVNGDGLLDIVGFGQNVVEVSLNTRRGYERAVPWTSSFVYGNGGWQEDKYPRYVQDVNGDGFADIVAFGSQGVYVGLSNGVNGFSNGVCWSEGFSGSSGWDQVSKYPRFLADFNGDGLLDILGFSNGGVEVGLNTGSSFRGLGIVLSHYGASQNWKYDGDDRDGDDQITLSDMNGDGLIDIVGLSYNDEGQGKYNYEVRVSLSTGTGFTSPKSWLPNGSTFGMDKGYYTFNFFLQDMNGDGMSDFMFTSPQGMFLATSTGQDFLYPQLWTSNYEANKQVFTNEGFDEVWGYYFLRMGDFNGDGQSELISLGGSRVSVVLNSKVELNPYGTWSRDVRWREFNTKERDEYDKNQCEIADINGDGISDILGFMEDGVYVSYSQSREGFLLESVIDDRGLQFTATYGLMKDGDVYERSSEASVFPLYNFNGPMRLCKRLQSRTSDLHYSYQGSKIHLQGRGFLGFEKLITKDVRNLLLTTQESKLFLPYYLLLPYKSTIQKLPSHRLVQTEEQNYRIINLGNGRISPQHIHSMSYSGVDNTYEESHFTYDLFGNVLTFTSNNGLSVKTNTFTYLQSAFRSIPNRLESSTSTHFYINGSTRLTPKVQRYHYDSRGNISKEINYFNTPLATTTSYQRNSFGLPLKTRFEALGISPREILYGYDSYGRFVLSERTALGTTFEEYEPIFGRLLSEKDLRGNTTRYAYNLYGMNTRVESPIGTTTDYSFRSLGAKKQYLQRQKKSNGGELVVSLDSLGRAIRKSTRTINGESIVETIYNSQGQISAVSDPYFLGDPILWTTYTYDDFNRVLTTTFQGLTTTITYDGLTTTTTLASGQISSQTYNSDGDLVRSEDGGGSIIYEYEFPGLVSGISAPGGANTTIVYDSYGRQISFTDPNTGTITYEYNVLGDVIHQMDARGYSTHTYYDELGRVIQTQTNSPLPLHFGETELTTYEYGPYGDIAKITTSEGAEQIYTYDGFGRVLALEDKLEENLITRYTYNEQGDIDTYQYPSGYTLKYLYSKGGILSEIRDDYSGLIWKLNQVNAYGQELKSTYFRNQIKRNTYNVFNQLLTTQLSNMMDYRYEYEDATGNMISRYNALKDGKVEFFSYDHLNRLTTDVDYSDNGNILYKSSIGNYYYHPSKVHAVTEVDLYSPTQGQQIDYNSFGKIKHLKQGQTSLHFTYGPTQGRRKMEYYNGYTFIQKRYAQNYEEIQIGASDLVTIPNNPLVSGGKIEIGGDGFSSSNSSPTKCSKEYIYSPYGLVALRSNEELFLIGTDHLGSIVAEKSTTTSHTSYYDYDAWGNRSFSGMYTEIDRLLLGMSRGYTGHEHLDEFGLINMNGRLYDPALGRMLSPDPYVPDNTYTQDFNRYSYARNNPLSYVDPDGEFVVGAAFLISMGTGLAIGAISGGIRAVSQDKPFWEGAWKGAVVGLVGGTLAPIGGAGLSFATNLALGIGQGALTGTLDAALWGENVLKGMAWGALSGAVFTTFTSDNFRNLIKGETFKTNANLFNDFMSRPDMTCQEILDYYGFEGTYVPNSKFGETANAITIRKTGSIYYSEACFDGSYDRLAFIADHEAIHKLNESSGKYIGKKHSDIVNKEEWSVYMKNYQNQGKYPNHNYNLMNSIKAFGEKAYIYGYIGHAKKAGSFYSFNAVWWHNFYKIPRRW